MKTLSVSAIGLCLLAVSCSSHYQPAPAGHTSIFENNRVRVMEIINPPGGKIPLHNHDLPGVIIVHHTANNVIRNAKEEIVSQGSPPEGAVWVDAHGPHYSIENIDNHSMHLYRVEIK